MRRSALTAAKASGSPPIEETASTFSRNSKPRVVSVKDDLQMEALLTVELMGCAPAAERRAHWPEPLRPATDQATAPWSPSIASTGGDGTITKRSIVSVGQPRSFM